MKRRLKQLVLVLVTSFGLSLGGAGVASAYNPPDPSYGPYPQVDGRAGDDLNLVVNTGWPAYVSKSVLPIFGNTWETQDGVRSAFPNRFKFVSGNYDPQTKTGLVSYQGWVRYSGHPSFINQKPVMNMRLADPQIRIGESAVQLVFQVESSPFTTDMGQPGLDPVNRGALVLYELQDVADFHNNLAQGKDFQLPNSWINTQSLHDIFGFYQAGEIAEALSNSVLPVSKFTKSTDPRVEIAKVDLEKKEVTVKGYNFNLNGQGYYAALAPNNDYTKIDRSQALWIVPPSGSIDRRALRSFSPSNSMAARLPQKTVMDNNGNWEGKLAIPENAGEGNWQLVVWPAHTEPGAGNLLFSQEVNLKPATPKPDSSSCKPALSHEGLIDRGGAKVKVNGSGYKTESPGIYVAIVPQGGSLKDAYGKAEWVGGIRDTKAGVRLIPEANAACGSFSLELVAPPALDPGKKYEILTLRAHGMDQEDPSQTLRIPLLYVDPPAAQPVVVPTQICKDDPNILRITGGSLSWGLKKSFTTYIRSSITKGKWETSNGVNWNGDSFVWASAGGQYDLQKQQGRIDYTGTVHFTGHNGVLDLTISNPTIVFNGPGDASLYLSVSSTTFEGKPVPLGRINFAKINAQVNVVGNSLRIQAGNLNLTTTGAKAFAGFYESGQVLDGLYSTLTTRYANSCDKDYEALKNNALARTGSSVDLYLWLALISVLSGLVLVASVKTIHAVKR